MATSTGYIQLPITTDVDALIQTSLQNISKNLTGWVPREGNLEVLLIEQFAYMVAEAANVASDVPKSIFRYFGNLVGITPKDGTKSQLKAAWTLVNPAPTGGQFIAAGSVAGFYYQGNAYQFLTISDVTIAAGERSAEIVMEASEAGIGYNIDSLTGFTAVGTYLTPTPNNPLLSQVAITGTPASNSSLLSGVDPETDAAYLDRLSAELQYLTPRPITANDYAQISTNVDGVYRSAVLDGFNPFANRFHVQDAYTGPTTTTPVASWGVVGNGTNFPSIAAPTSSVPLTITTSSVALGSTYITTATTAGATTLNVKGQIVLSATTSTPVFILIEEAGAQEIAMVTAVASVGSGGSTTYNLTIGGSGLVYPHAAASSGTYVTALQGVKTPTVTGLAANTDWYQLGAQVKCGTGTTNTASVYVAGLATYNDNTKRVFSSAPISGPALFDHTNQVKTIFCPVDSHGSSSLANAASSAFTGIKQNISSLQAYVLIKTTELSRTHFIYTAGLMQTPFNFSAGGNEDLNNSNSKYNFLPDATFSSYNATSFSSWYVPPSSNLVVLPGIGLQLVGTGSASVADVTVPSQFFTLSNIATSGTATTSRQYTVFANIDTTYCGATYDKIALEIIDAGSNSILATVSPTNNSIQTVVATFTLASAPATVFVRLNFQTGLNVINGSSIIISQIGLLSGSLSTAQLPSKYQAGYTWSPGDQYVTNAYVAPRSVALVPVDQSGLAVNTAVNKTLVDYLETYREINFNVYSLSPNYVPIDVVWTGTVNPGYAVGDVQTAGNAAIRKFLSPANWGGGDQSPPKWDITQTNLTILDIAGVLSIVPGIANITSIKIAVTSTTLFPTTVGTGNVGMTGVAPLPIANNVVGTVYSNSSDVALGSV
jgi:hypothetical protein